MVRWKCVRSVEAVARSSSGGRVLLLALTLARSRHSRRSLLVESVSVVVVVVGTAVRHFRWAARALSRAAVSRCNHRGVACWRACARACVRAPTLPLCLLLLLSLLLLLLLLLLFAIVCRPECKQVNDQPANPESWFAVGCYYYLIGKNGQAKRCV